jgi:hypothetical protein
MLIIVGCWPLCCGCQDFEGETRAAVAWLKTRVANRQVLDESFAAPVAVQPTYQRPDQFDTDTPRTAAAAFLDAIRFGDEGIARSLLTSAAQLAVQQQQRSIGFPGSPAAVHYVGQVEFPDADDVAHVWCTWCDQSTGTQQPARMVLIERKELPGWRIAGLVFLDANGDFGDVVNFEQRARIAANP